MIARSAIFLSAFPYNVPRTENLTGQILAGLDPLEAVKYQILLMFLLSGGSGLSALATSYMAAWRLTDDRQRLRLDRLK